jgi:hypothetical protein
MTAHRILIGTALAFFLGYAVWELARGGGGGGAVLRAALAGIGAASLGFYLRTLVGR